MTRRSVQRVFLIVALAVTGLPAVADVRLPKIFTDNMVLQQELPLAVWGWAQAGEKVTVTLAGRSATAAADKDGTWRVALPATKADGKPQTLTVRGKNTIERKNVLLGEVWLCAGQSNMNRDTKVDQSDPAVRLFWIDGSTTPRKDDLGDDLAGWVPATPEGVAKAAPPKKGRDAGKPRSSFTEVGYVFGRKIHQELKVPVGLIKCAFGGSNVAAWTPVANVEELYPFGKPVEGRYVGHRKGLLYQSMVHGFAGMAMRGVIWYQGENDGRSTTYHLDLQKWIASWRGIWQRPDMPFYLVQIAPTSYAGGRMQYIWEAQAWVMHHVPHTALAVTNDMMPDKDRAGKDLTRADKVTGFPLLGTSNPHPSNKHIAAERLADIALVRTYGKPDRVLFGPMYDSHKIEGGKVIVKLKYTGSGLATRDGKAPDWFELSDGTKENRRLKFVPAAAKIVGKDTVEVSSPDVKDPKFVRFAWHCMARHNLMNKEGLPAVSFKTDEPIGPGR